MAAADQQTSLLVSAAWLSVLSNSVLTAAKAWVGIASGSLSVVSEAAHSASDVLASFIALAAIRTAARPADDSHPFGHGKFESLSAGIEGVILIAAGAWIAAEAIVRLSGHEQPQVIALPGAIVMLAAVLANVTLSAYLIRVGKRYKSPALYADGVHLRADVWTGAGVVVGLVAIQLGAPTAIDAGLAAIVAGVVIAEGVLLIAQSGAELLDTAVPLAEREIIQKVIHEQPGPVISFHGLCTRRHGRYRQADVHLVVCHRLTVKQAHEMSEQLQQALRKVLPQTELVVHIEPCENDACQAPNPSGQAG